MNARTSSSALVFSPFLSPAAVGVYRSAATRPPLPAGVLLAMAATGGKGVGAFAPPTPAERPGIVTMCRADAPKDGGGSRWPRLTASGRGLHEMTSTSSRRLADYGPRWRGGAGRRDGCTHRGGQVGRTRTHYYSCTWYGASIQGISICMIQACFCILRMAIGVK